MKCFYCGVKSDFVPKKTIKDLFPNRKLDLDILIKFMESSIKLGLKSIKITGGEPFINRDTFDIISWANRKNVKVLIESNGSLIKDDTIKYLYEKNVSAISFSLDGPNEKVYSKMRGNVFGFKSIINAVDKIRKGKYFIPYSITCVLSRSNSDYLIDMIDFSYNLGATSLKINPVLVLGRNKFNDEILKPREIYQLYEKSKKYFLSKKFKGFKFIFEIPVSFRFTSLKHLIKYNNDIFTFCRIKNILSILPDGDVSICSVGKYNKELVIGNIKNNSVEDIWYNSELLNSIRNDLKDRLKGVCKRCLFKNICLGRCRAEQFNVSSDLYDSYYFCQTAYDEGWFPKNVLLE